MPYHVAKFEFQCMYCCVNARMRHSNENLCEVFRALAALAQPASFGNQYFRNAVGLFFLAVYHFDMQSDVLGTDILSCAN